MFGGPKSPRLFGLLGPKRQRGFLNVGPWRGALGGTWNPRDWFRRSEPGFWYEAVDPANQGATITMYQDSVGTTPVTAPEQAVGLVLDRSRGLVRGVELVTNGTFDTDLTGWTNGDAARGTATLVANAIRLDTSGTGNTYYHQGVATTAGKSYAVSVRMAGTQVHRTIVGTTPGSSGLGSSTSNAIDGTYTLVFVASGATSYISIQVVGTTGYADFDNISVRELPGNHASQSVSASRPVISQRYNLLTNTAFSGAAAGTPGTVPTGWSFGTSSGTLAVPAEGLTFSTAGSARHYIQLGSLSLQASTSYVLSVDVVDTTGGSVAILDAVATGGSIVGTPHILASAGTGRQSVTVTAGAAGATVAVRVGAGVNALTGGAFSVTLKEPDLRLTIDTTKGMPAYQRVNTSTDYDTAGFLPYFKFDGFDDSWQTAAIDFSSTDKVTVVAGVTKLSDAAGGQLMETSADYSANAGAFMVRAPRSAAANYSVGLRGDTGALDKYTTSAALASPLTAVLTLLFDIAQASVDTEAVIRVNGAVAATNTPATAAGAGNLGNHVLNIGRRNNATLPLNARLSVLIGRGAAANDSQIIKAERYVNRRTGASF